MESPRSSAEAMARELSEEYGNLVPYTAPIWARERGLKIVPEKRYVVSDDVIINAHTCKMYPHLLQTSTVMWAYMCTRQCKRRDPGGGAELFRTR